MNESDLLENDPNYRQFVENQAYTLQRQMSVSKLTKKCFQLVIMLIINQI